MTQIFPALDAATEAALRASITQFGVILPVVVDQHGEILDGHHRARLAEENGAKYDVLIREVADEAEAREIARTLNEDRRMLTREQRVPVVKALREEGHSQRAIAGALGLSKTTVVRDLEREVVPPDHLPPKTIGLDGKGYPAKRRLTPLPSPETPRGQVIRSAAARRLYTMMGALDGYREGLKTFRVDAAVAAASSDDLAAWERSASEFITALNIVRRKLKEARYAA